MIYPFGIRYCFLNISQQNKKRERLLKDGRRMKGKKTVKILWMWIREEPSIFQYIICNFHNLYNLWNNYYKKKNIRGEGYGGIKEICLSLKGRYLNQRVFFPPL